MSTPSPVPPPPSYYQPRPRSIFGPLVLISLGILFLLRSSGLVPGQAMRMWFAHYWPVLLIIWGVIKLAEYLLAQHRGRPTPRFGGGSIVFLIFFIMFGFGFSRTADWDWSRLNGDWDNGDWGDWGAGSSYDYTENFAQPLDDVAQIKILCNRGDINITASDDNQAHVVVKKSLRSDSQSSADRVNESTRPKFIQQGGIWLMDLTSGDFEHGKFDMELQLPRRIALSLSTKNGNLSVVERDRDIDLDTNHGNVRVENVKGLTNLHVRGDVTVKNVTGNVHIDGNVDDGEISDIKGNLDFNAGYNGTVQLERISQGLHLKSVRTDLQLAKLDGEMTLGHGDVRASSIGGPVRLNTRSNEVHLDDVSGEVEVENRNGVVELKAKEPLGAIDISNVHGGIELDLPESSGFRLDAQSSNGNVDVSDFSVKVDNSGRDGTARGTVGKGGPDIRLRADRGTIQIRKQ